jgi:hypothetical protein
MDNNTDTTTPSSASEVQELTAGSVSRLYCMPYR